MIRTKLAQIIDTIILSISIALLSYVWIIKFTKNIATTIVLSGLISFFIAKIIWSLTKKQTNKHNLKQNEIVFAENCIQYFSINPKECNLFFRNFFGGTNINNNCLLVDNQIYYIDYLNENLTFSIIVKAQEIAKKHNASKIYFLSHKPTQKASLLLNSPCVHYLSYDDVFVLLKEKKSYPIEMSKAANTHKIHLKSAIISLINRKKAKHYFGYGILLLCLSFIIPFTFWYTVMGSLFIILAVISLITKQKSLP